jgi:[ribosomal protein S5]-alanine N-acetyltransferase
MKQAHFPLLSTSRLRLRRVSEEDVKHIMFLRSDPEVNKFVNRPTPKNTDDVLEFIDKLENQFEAGLGIYWVITLKDKEDMIGSICLWNFSADRKMAELGYDLHPSFQKQGVMAEAIENVVGFGFETLLLEEIEAYTQNNNLPSITLLKKQKFICVEGKDDPDNKLNLVFSKRCPQT